MKFQIQKKQQEWWNCGITNTNIKGLKSCAMRGQKLFREKKLWGGCSKSEG